MSGFELNKDHIRWASRSRQGAAPRRLTEMLIQQRATCALSGVEMIFDLSERTPVSGGRGCHPLSPAVDHIDSGNSRSMLQIVCYALNDLKGHLPAECFDALADTGAWKRLMVAWRRQAKINPGDRDAFAKLLRPNADH